MVTTALFLGMLRDLFFGPTPEARRGFPDLDRAEGAVLAVLLGFVELIGVWPAWLLGVIEAGAAAALGSAPAGSG